MRAPASSANLGPGFDCIAAALALRFPVLSCLAILLAIVLNFALYRFFASKRGWPFAVQTVPMHLLYPGGEHERFWLEEVVAIGPDGGRPLFSWGFGALTM